MIALLELVAAAETRPTENPPRAAAARVPGSAERRRLGARRGCSRKRLWNASRFTGRRSAVSRSMRYTIGSPTARAATPLGVTLPKCSSARRGAAGGSGSSCPSLSFARPPRAPSAASAGARAEHGDDRVGRREPELLELLLAHRLREDVRGLEPRQLGDHARELAGRERLGARGPARVAAALGADRHRIAVRARGRRSRAAGRRWRGTARGGARDRRPPLRGKSEIRVAGDLVQHIAARAHEARARPSGRPIASESGGCAARRGCAASPRNPAARAACAARRSARRRTPSARRNESVESSIVDRVAVGARRERHRHLPLAAASAAAAPRRPASPARPALARARARRGRPASAPRPRAIALGSNARICLSRRSVSERVNAVARWLAIVCTAGDIARARVHVRADRRRLADPQRVLGAADAEAHDLRGGVVEAVLGVGLRVLERRLARHVASASAIRATAGSAGNASGDTICHFPSRCSKRASTPSLVRSAIHVTSPGSMPGNSRLRALLGVEPRALAADLVEVEERAEAEHREQQQGRGAAGSSPRSSAGLRRDHQVNTPSTAISLGQHEQRRGADRAELLAR